MNEKPTNRADDDMRDEYQRETLGTGVRGKYHDRFSRGTNLVLLDDRIAKAFPTSKAVNEALGNLLRLAEHSARTVGSSTDRNHNGH